MTSADVLNVVEAEIASRYRNLGDTVRGDWVRAIWRAGDIETARAVIRGLVDDPEAALNVKQFHKRLTRALTVGKQATNGPAPEPAAYNPFVMCLEAPAEYPSWQGREWFIMGGPSDCTAKTFCRSDQASKQRVADFASDMAKEYQRAYGGEWCGVVREAGNTPYDGQMSTLQRRHEAERRIIDGPDTPARRWLYGRMGSEIVPDLKDVNADFS